PAFPDVSTLQEITEDILVNFQKCKELQVKPKISKNELDQLDKQSNTFNKLTERRATESLKMSEYLTDVVKYLQLVSKENVNVNAIKQTLGSLLKTAKVQKDRSEKLKNDYISFHKELNKAKKRQLNTNLIFYLLGLLVLFIAIAWNIYLYTNLGYYSALQQSDFAEKTNNFSLNDACNFCKDIDQVKDICRYSDHREGLPYNFSVNDGYEICGHFFKETCVMNDDSLGSQIVSLVKSQFFSISNIVNYRNSEDNYCKVKNQDILQNNETFYEICEYLLENRKDEELNDFMSEIEDENDSPKSIHICKQWQTSKNPIHVKDMHDYSLVIYSLIGCLAILLVIFMMKELVNWIFQQDDDEKVTALDKRSGFIRHIRDRFPEINDNIITLDQFWKAQITIINDHISVLESINTNKINLSHQLVDLIIRLWDEECKRCKSCYYKLNESIALNSILE
ncbi:10499_t:CDS:2, partial [Racocetra fulgida]